MVQNKSTTNFAVLFAITTLGIKTLSPSPSGGSTTGPRMPTRSKCHFSPRHPVPAASPSGQTISQTSITSRQQQDGGRLYGGCDCLEVALGSSLEKIGPCLTKANCLPRFRSRWREELRAVVRCAHPLDELLRCHVIDIISCDGPAPKNRHGRKLLSSPQR